MFENTEDKFLVYTLPAYLAGYLVNNDPSNLKDEEIKEIDEFIKNENLGSCLDWSQVSWFTWRNDLNRLGSDVMEFTFHNLNYKP